MDYGYDKAREDNIDEERCRLREPDTLRERYEKEIEHVKTCIRICERSLEDSKNVHVIKQLEQILPVLRKRLTKLEKDKHTA